MLLFDPPCGDQLNICAKLALKSLVEEHCCSLYLAFYNLFNAQGNKGPKIRRYTIDDLLWSIEEAGGKDVVIRYGSHIFEALEAYCNSTQLEWSSAKSCA